MIKFKIQQESYEFPRNFTETDESYYGRYWFVEQLKPKDHKEYLSLIRFSNIWISIKVLGCRYPTDTEREINELIKKIDKDNNILTKKIPVKKMVNRKNNNNKNLK